MTPASKHRADTGPRVSYRVETPSPYRRRIARRLTIRTASHSGVAGVAAALVDLAG